MIILDCEQGSVEWKLARLGIPTASEFKKIVTTKGALSASRNGYMMDLITEAATNEPKDDISNLYWVQRGKELEPEAFDFYSVYAKSDPVKVGFVYRDESRNVGCSPDALVGDDGLLEIKCPSPGEHIMTAYSGILPIKHIQQVQGQLWVTGRQWCDYLSYCDEYPEFEIRVNRDDVFQAALDKHIPKFAEELEMAKQWAVRNGFIDE